MSVFVFFVFLLAEAQRQTVNKGHNTGSTLEGEAALRKPAEEGYESAKEPRFLKVNQHMKEYS